MSASIMNPIFEDGKGYPYPSHVCAANVVTVKLSGCDKYNAWKSQMLCLLVSHNMVGFINGKFVSPQGKVGDVEAWIRSDALVKSWILSCLSEKATIYVVNHLTSGLKNADFTAKNAWDELQSLYGPGGVLQQAKEDGKSEDDESGSGSEYESKGKRKGKRKNRNKKRKAEAETNNTGLCLMIILKLFGCCSCGDGDTE